MKILIEESTLRQALEALEDSVNLVQNEFDTDWRHGVPTRKSQLAYMEEMLQKHKDSIPALRAAIEQMEKCEPVALDYWHQKDCEYLEQRTKHERMEKAEPVAWFDNTGTLRGRVSSEQLEQLCRDHLAKYCEDEGCPRNSTPHAHTAPAVPECMVPLRLEFEPGYPEDVAFGTQRQMDRLKQWLDKYFAMIQAPAVPEGWKLVPIEPTSDMKSAGLDVEVGEEGLVLTWEESVRIYKAMLAAAPEVKP